MKHFACTLSLYRHRFHNRQAVGHKNEASLFYTVPGLSGAVTALLVSVYGLSVCVPGLFCWDVTSSTVEEWETSCLDGKWPSQVSSVLTFCC